MNGVTLGKLQKAEKLNRSNDGHVTMTCYLGLNHLRDEVRASQGSSTLPPTKERAVDKENRNCSRHPQ